jgi:hypothetical protein
LNRQGATMVHSHSNGGFKRRFLAAIRLNATAGIQVSKTPLTNQSIIIWEGLTS